MSESIRTRRAVVDILRAWARHQGDREIGPLDDGIGSRGPTSATLVGTWRDDRSRAGTRSTAATTRSRSCASRGPRFWDHDDPRRGELRHKESDRVAGHRPPPARARRRKSRSRTTISEIRGGRPSRERPSTVSMTTAGDDVRDRRPSRPAGRQSIRPAEHDLLSRLLRTISEKGWLMTSGCPQSAIPSPHSL